MRHTVKVGTRHDREFVVDPDRTIAFPGGGAPPMLSTPALILELELTARDAIAADHAADQASVGTFLEIEHLAPTPLGARVRCSARVVHSEGPVVTFTIEAHDGVERIARGLHRRRIVSRERFAKRLNAKTPSDRLTG